MGREMYEYNGFRFGVYEYPLNERQIRNQIWDNTEIGKGEKARYCPLCREEFKAEDNVCILIGNNKLIPNIMIHADEFNKDRDSAMKELVMIWEFENNYKSIWI
jgi:hypothetical protein